MPEGHTLHRLARLHQRRYAGKPVEVSSPQGKFTDASTVDGRVLVRAEAYGKHLFHRYDAGTVHIHLGLYGTFTEGTLPAPAPVGQVRMRLIGSTQWTDLRGPNRCELLNPDQVDAIKARLGADPLRRDAKPDQAFERISSSRTSLAALLMDQAVVAGVGNVYRAELLFRHGVAPMLPGKSLDSVLWKEMWADLVTLMRYGVRTGRIDTVADEHLPEVTGRAPRQDRHGGEVYVYRRTGQPCLVCGTPIAHQVLAGRNLYWCPACQPG
ncbi:Fpg/Nei family DNA glycosylase [Amycolatopsis sp. GM8]|uniref:Fpg/Nei family DNA glycosylase n=1 Tax=Amycolatopsis sp. GM8 TaxID=2896530 RepID=UPI001F266739|nr:zinc finger domain-containing protein [Amycolatopsis sp. GM8]